MERVVLREKFVNDNDFFERIKIGVVPISRGAGATLIATSVAKVISENEMVKVSFVEISQRKKLGERITFDSIGIDRRFAGRSFTDLFKLAEQGGITRGITNIDEGINWILHTPSIPGASKIGEESNRVNEPLENLRVLNSAPGDVIICDFEIHPEMLELLTDMDVLIVVIDPIPSAMIAGYETLGFCKALAVGGKRIIWVVNKDNGGVNKRELIQFIRLKDIIFIPYISAEELYNAEYNCLLPISKREVRTNLVNGVNKIIKLIFG